MAANTIGVRGVLRPRLLHRLLLAVVVGVILGLTGGEYAVLIPVVVASIAQAIVTVIVALRQLPQVKTAVEAVHQEIKPPSNHHTAGEILEDVASAAEVAATEAAKVRKTLAKKEAGT